jgi:hypothetical protein
VSAKTYTCGCGCGGERCIVCEGFACKWPGECAGKCRECGGGPIKRLDVTEPDGSTLTVSIGCSFCSEACYLADNARAVAEGRIINVSDLAPEQLNEMLKRDGLQLAGVGDRMPS